MKETTAFKKKEYKQHTHSLSQLNTTQHNSTSLAPQILTAIVGIVRRAPLLLQLNHLLLLSAVVHQVEAALDLVLQADNALFHAIDLLLHRVACVGQTERPLDGEDRAAKKRKKRNQIFWRTENKSKIFDACFSLLPFFSLFQFLWKLTCLSPPPASCRDSSQGTKSRPRRRFADSSGRTCNPTCCGAILSGGKQC